MNHRTAPGLVRDSIVDYLAGADSASLSEIQEAVATRLGEVRASSVRSYLNINTPDVFERTSRGHYKLRVANGEPAKPIGAGQKIERATLIEANCFEWMRACEPHTIHGIVTDPPYGLVEYTEKEQGKLRNGHGGVWRIPPSFDGHQRAPLPRFTVLNDGDRSAMQDFFFEFAQLALRVTVPG